MGARSMIKIITAILLAGGLAGCAAAPPATTAEDADAATCTAQADATYNANSLDTQARPSQTGQIFTATPNHVFDAETLGALHQRDSQLATCEANGANAPNPTFLGAPVVTPHIINPP